LIVDRDGERMAEFDGLHQLVRIAIRLEPPDRRHPHRGIVATAVNEENRQRLLLGARVKQWEQK